MPLASAHTFADPTVMTEHNLQGIEDGWRAANPDGIIADLIHTVRVLRSYIADGPHVRRMKR